MNFSSGNYAPTYTPIEERDFFSYYDNLKYKKFFKDVDDSPKKTKIINFDLIHHECRGDELEKPESYYQTVFEDKLKNYKRKDKRKFVASTLRNQKALKQDIFIEKKLVSEHFTSYCNVKK